MKPLTKHIPNHALNSSGILDSTVLTGIEDIKWSSARIVERGGQDGIDRNCPFYGREKSSTSIREIFFLPNYAIGECS
jgi:hypothetical protein